MTAQPTPQLRPFTRDDLAEAIDLLAAEGWETYTTDPERTYRTLTAPGCTTVVALDAENLIALVHLQSDGEIQAHLSALIVNSRWRRRGLGRLLLFEALQRAGGIRIDVLSRAAGYYLSLGAEPIPGFRLRGQHLDIERPAKELARAAG